MPNDATTPPAKRFPCQACKGEGSWIVPVLDYGMGPREECGWCEGKGMIEVGSEIHRRNAEAMREERESKAFLRRMRALDAYHAEIQ